MPELTEAECSSLRSVVGAWGPALSSVLSESAGRLISAGEPSVDQVRPADLSSEFSRDSETPVCVGATWSFPEIGEDEVIALLSVGEARQLAAAISGPETASETTSETTSGQDEATVATLAPTLTPVFEAVAERIGALISVTMERASQVVPSNVQSAVGPLTFPQAFAAGDVAVAVRVPFQVESGPGGTLTICFTPALAAAIAASANAADSADSADSADRIPSTLSNSASFPHAPLEHADYGGFCGGFAGPLGAGLGGPTGGGPLAGMTPSASPFQAFDPIGSQGLLPEGITRSMDLIMDIPLDVSVELGRVQMLIKDVLELATGSIVELERVAGEPVDLLVNGQLIAKGEVVVIEDNFGIRITEIVSPVDRLHGMGKRAA